MVSDMSCVLAYVGDCKTSTYISCCFKVNPYYKVTEQTEHKCCIARVRHAVSVTRFKSLRTNNMDSWKL